jgi:hypothetical protein
MWAAGVGKKMKMMKAIEAARAGHEGIHRPRVRTHAKQRHGCATRDYKQGMREAEP